MNTQLMDLQEKVNSLIRCIEKEMGMGLGFGIECGLGKFLNPSASLLGFRYGKWAAAYEALG